MAVHGESGTCRSCGAPVLWVVRFVSVGLAGGYIEHTPGGVRLRRLTAAELFGLYLAIPGAMAAARRLPAVGCGKPSGTLIIPREGRA